MPARMKPVEETVAGERRSFAAENSRVVTLDAEQQFEIPPLPASVTEPKAQAAWEAYWSGPTPHVLGVSATDPPLLRWIEALDEYADLSARYRLEPVTKGSTGQDRQNPLVTRINKLETSIAKYEDQFGMTPHARMKLGIKGYQQQRSLADLFDAGEGDGAEWVQPPQS